jgi:hypothetical protein
MHGRRLQLIANDLTRKMKDRSIQLGRRERDLADTRAVPHAESRLRHQAGATERQETQDTHARLTARRLSERWDRRFHGNTPGSCEIRKIKINRFRLE